MATLRWSNNFCRHSVPLRAPLSKPSSSRSSTLSALRASFRHGSSSCSSSSSAPSSFSLLDVSVFQLPLGIPVFHDSTLLGVVGITSGAVLLLNHFLTADYVTAAQWVFKTIPWQLKSPYILSAHYLNWLPNARSLLLSWAHRSTRMRSELIDLCDVVFCICLPSFGKSLNVFWNGGLVCAQGLWDVPQEGQGDVFEWLEKSSLFTYNTSTCAPFKAGVKPITSHPCVRNQIESRSKRREPTSKCWAFHSFQTHIQAKQVQRSCLGATASDSSEPSYEDLKIGSPIMIIEAPPHLKTAEPMPMLRANAGTVMPGDAGRIISRKPKDVWAIRLKAGAFLIERRYFKPLSVE